MEFRENEAPRKEITFASYASEQSVIEEPDTIFERDF